jgi:hypothetical protein
MKAASTLDSSTFSHGRTTLRLTVRSSLGNSMCELLDGEGFNIS